MTVNENQGPLAVSAGPPLTSSPAPSPLNTVTYAQKDILLLYDISEGDNMLFHLVLNAFCGLKTPKEAFFFILINNFAISTSLV